MGEWGSGSVGEWGSGRVGEEVPAPSAGLMEPVPAIHCNFIGVSAVLKKHVDNLDLACAGGTVKRRGHLTVHRVNLRSRVKQHRACVHKPQVCAYTTYVSVYMCRHTCVSIYVSSVYRRIPQFYLGAHRYMRRV